jgi:hypothetical protein
VLFEMLNFSFVSDACYAIATGDVGDFGLRLKVKGFLPLGFSSKPITRSSFVLYFIFALLSFFRGSSSGVPFPPLGL